MRITTTSLPLTIPSSASMQSHPFGSVFSRALPICRRHIHQPQCLYVFTRASSIRHKGYLLPFLCLRGWSALLTLKSFETSLVCLLVGTVSSSVAMPNCAKTHKHEVPYPTLEAQVGSQQPMSIERDCRQLGQQSTLLPACLQRSWLHFPLRED